MVRGRSASKAVAAYAKAYAACVVAFCALLVVVSCVPRSWIRANVEESTLALTNEGDYPIAWPTATMNPHDLDSFTTALSLNIAMHVTGRPPFGAFAGTYYIGQATMVDNLAAGLDEPGQVDYIRYWHGYLAVLVPLLVVCNLTQIRVLFVCSMSMLACLVCALLARRAGTGAALSLGVACLFTNLWAVAASTSLAFSFFVAFGAMLYVIARVRPGSAALGEDVTGVFFFVVGAVTVFVDFLDTPIVTLGLPLATYCLLQGERIGRAPLRRVLAVLATLALAWAAGYALLWVTKWVISLAMFGMQSWAETASTIGGRLSTADPSGQGSITRVQAVLANVRYFVTRGVACVAGALVLACALLTVRHRNERMWRCGLVLLLVAMLPVVWYVALPNHSFQHAFFTFRSLSVTAYALCLALACVVDWRSVWRGALGLMRGRDVCASREASHGDRGGE